MEKVVLCTPVLSCTKYQCTWRGVAFLLSRLISGCHHSPNVTKAISNQSVASVLQGVLHRRHRSLGYYRHCSLGPPAGFNRQLQQSSDIFKHGQPHAFWKSWSEHFSNTSFSDCLRSSTTAMTDQVVRRTFSHFPPLCYFCMLFMVKYWERWTLKSDKWQGAFRCAGSSSWRRVTTLRLSCKPWGLDTSPGTIRYTFMWYWCDAGK